jgi:hypothetical protein
MVEREPNGPTPPSGQVQQVIARSAIVVVTVSAGVALSLWIMKPEPRRAPSIRPAEVTGTTPLRGQIAAPAPVAPAVEPPPPPAAPNRPTSRAAPARAASIPAPRRLAAPLAAPPAAPLAAPLAAPVAASVACKPNAGVAEAMICANPALAAAERDTRRATRRAVAAGRHPDEAAWLAVREEAAQRSPAALAVAYRRHITALNRLADPPH